MADEEKRGRRIQATIEQEKQHQLRAGLRHILSNSDARAWLWNTLAEAGVGNQPYRLGDPHATAFSCGELNVGNKLLSAIINVEPEAYIKMMKEQADVRRRNEQRIRNYLLGDSDGNDD